MSCFGHFSMAWFTSIDLLGSFVNIEFINIFYKNYISGVNRYCA